LASFAYSGNVILNQKKDLANKSFILLNNLIIII